MKTSERTAPTADYSNGNFFEEPPMPHQIPVPEQAPIVEVRSSPAGRASHPPLAIAVNGHSSTRSIKLSKLNFVYSTTNA
jgi:hypothetical protein